jgi:hypothetical protein
MARGTTDWGAVSGGLQGVAELPTYAGTTGTRVITTTQRTLLSIFNPAGSNHLVKVRSVRLTLSMLANAGNDNVAFLLSRITTPGSGDPVTIAKLDTGDPDPVAEVQWDHTSEPSFGANLDVWGGFATFEDTATEARAFGSDQLVELYRQQPGDDARPITLLEGEGLAVVISVGSPRFIAGGSFRWTEEPT